MTRLSTSRPKRSVPKKACAPGLASIRSKFCSSGAVGASTPAKSAMPTIASANAAPIATTVLRAARRRLFVTLLRVEETRRERRRVSRQGPGLDSGLVGRDLRPHFSGEELTAEVDGATLVARNLKRQGVEYMFGIVGFPVQPIAAAAQKEGITYVGMRNEQSASYAAQAVGYLTGRPGACLVVSGPGVVHALAGLANAQQNGWPMICIGGASETWRNGMGAFQEERQVYIATPFCKFAHAIEHVHRIPFYVEMAVRNAIYGRPGASYLDIADDIITGKVDEVRVEEAARCPDPPRTQAVPADVERALDVMRSAERPLVIIGKGMAYSRAEDEVRAFIERTKVPFLASPMGKGVMPDTHPLSVGAARSHALQNADVVFLMGARLNWIMHFGLPPRYHKDVRFIQLDIAAETIGQNAPTEVALVGDGQAIVGQLNQALEKREWVYPKDAPWHAAIAEKAAANAAQIAPQLA